MERYLRFKNQKTILSRWNTAQSDPQSLSLLSPSEFQLSTLQILTRWPCLQELLSWNFVFMSSSLGTSSWTIELPHCVVTELQSEGTSQETESETVGLLGSGSSNKYHYFCCILWGKQSQRLDSGVGA